jgi:hypothetical protein
MTDRELEQRLRAWYQSEIDDAEPALTELRASIAAIPRTRSTAERSFGSRRNLTLLAAAVVTTALIGGAIAAGSGLVRLTSVEPSPPSTVMPSASADETPGPTPKPSAWTATGNMKAVREYQTATLFADGRVLAAGGFVCCTPLDEAEIYDPTAGTWSVTGSLAAARRFHTASLLGDGKVLISGGLVGSGGEGTISLASCELYDPETGIWQATGPLITSRDRHTATVLLDGRVLSVGGADAAPGIRGDGAYGGRVLASAELYDPVTGMWSLTGGLAMAREAHFAVLLRSGEVLVVGGESGGTGLASSAEIYDPIAGNWIAAGNPGITHIDSATLLNNGAVLVTGTNGAGNAGQSAALYDPIIGKWSATGSPVVARSNATASILLTGRVLVAGGESNDLRTLASAELYDPDTGAWTSTADMSAARVRHTAVVLADGSVMVAGGEQLVPGPHLWLGSAEIYGPVR